MGNSPWPKPITDRPPTLADADENGRVQWYGRFHRTWNTGDWQDAVMHEDPWQHTPKWYEEQVARLAEAS